MSQTSVATKNAIGNGMSIGWMGCPAMLAVGWGLAMARLHDRPSVITQGRSRGFLRRGDHRVQRWQSLAENVEARRTIHGLPRQTRGGVVVRFCRGAASTWKFRPALGSRGEMGIEPVGRTIVRVPQCASVGQPTLAGKD